MAKSAVFIDLDRTLLRHASGQVLNQALVEEGVLPAGRSLPGDKLLYAVNDRLGENLFSMGLVRAAARVARGWHQDQVQAAGRRAVSALSELVAPFAPQRLAAFRADGHRLVLSTTTPVDMIAPFAEAFGLRRPDRHRLRDQGRPLHRPPLRGVRVGDGQAPRGAGVGRTSKGIDLADCHACSDSIFDVPLLSSVGSPHAVNPDPSLTVVATARRWPVEHWDRPPGRPERRRARAVPPAAPVRAQAVVPVRTLRHRGRRERADPGSRCCSASNHRSYFDVAALALVAREHRATGALPRQEGDLRRSRGRA